MSAAYLRGVKPKLSRDRDPLTRVPPAPKWLGEEARAEWKRVLPRLVEDRIITKADLTGIENYCVAAGRVRDLERAIQASAVPDARLMRMQNQAMQTARQLASEYGLSPTSRARVQAQEAGDDEPCALDL
jgi:P27 family predicted phage terminase small subunit